MSDYSGREGNWHSVQPHYNGLNASYARPVIRRRGPEQGPLVHHGSPTITANGSWLPGSPRMANRKGIYLAPDAEVAFTLGDSCEELDDAGTIRTSSEDTAESRDTMGRMKGPLHALQDTRFLSPMPRTSTPSGGRVSLPEVWASITASPRLRSLRHSDGRRSSLPVRKKSTPEPRALSRKNKGGRSPLLSRRPLAESAGVSLSAGRLRHSANSESALSTASQLEGTFSQDESDLADTILSVPSAANGSSYDPAGEEVDGAADAHRTKQAIDALQAKIHKTMDLIKIEQQEKEEIVNEYLRLSANADRQQQQRIKTVFEKRNQKSTSMLAQLQRKLESYQKRMRDVEMYGVSGHKQAKEVLRDMGQGLKDVGANIRDGLSGFSGGVVENIKGAKETIVSKPKEFARHLIKNKFGSADNISNIKLEENQGSTDDADKHSHHGGTLPARHHIRQDSGPAMLTSFKYPPSDDETSSITSGSVPSGLHHSPRSGGQLASSSQLAVVSSANPSSAEIETLKLALYESHQHRYKLEETVESLKAQLSSQCSFLKQALEEESERLEEQINDLTELHQHEVTNIKQEFSSMEEKMEYQLEERTRDMQELLETCQTRITKMELHQQQQQLISMEGIENSNFRALITKSINVVLALLAVLLVFVSTCANLLGPFLTTRLRVLTTICLIASIVAVWKNWVLVQDYGRHLVDQYRHLLPLQ